MFITIVFCVIALLAGAVVGWMGASARTTAEAERARTERDLARAERQRSDAAAAALQRRVQEETNARVAAETRLASLEQGHQQIENTFAALAHKAFAQVSES